MPATRSRSCSRVPDEGEREKETMKQGAIIEEIGGEPASGSEGTGSQTWHDTYSMLQWAEMESCLDAWVEAAKPAFGPEAAHNFHLVRSLDRRRVRLAAQRREEYF
jgi:hypothetical protein